MPNRGLALKPRNVRHPACLAGAWVRYQQGRRTPPRQPEMVALARSVTLRMVAQALRVTARRGRSRDRWFR